jgi:hypothetical protein
MPTEIILAIVEKGINLCESREMARVILEIWQAVKEVYADIAQAHFNSAWAALHAASNSRQPEFEIRAANGHLLDAFFVYQALLDKTRTKKLWLFFTQEVPLLNSVERHRVEKSLLDIATCIAVNYRDLDESVNASVWKANAMQYIDGYVEARVAQLTPEHIFASMGDKYVHHFTEEHRSGGSPTSNLGVFYRTVHRYELTDDGQAYIKQQRRVFQSLPVKIFRAKAIE